MNTDPMCRLADKLANKPVMSESFKNYYACYNLREMDDQSFRSEWKSLIAKVLVRLIAYIVSKRCSPEKVIGRCKRLGFFRRLLWRRIVSRFVSEVVTDQLVKGVIAQTAGGYYVAAIEEELPGAILKALPSLAQDEEAIQLFYEEYRFWSM